MIQISSKPRKMDRIYKRSLISFKIASICGKGSYKPQEVPLQSIKEGGGRSISTGIAANGPIKQFTISTELLLQETLTTSAKPSNNSRPTKHMKLWGSFWPLMVTSQRKSSNLNSSPKNGPTEFGSLSYAMTKRPKPYEQLSTKS